MTPETRKQLDAVLSDPVVTAHAADSERRGKKILFLSTAEREAIIGRVERVLFGPEPRAIG